MRHLPLFLLGLFAFASTTACTSEAEDGTVADDAMLQEATDGCTKAPCAERPVIFVHGHNGNNEDGATILNAFTAPGERFDAWKSTGTADHQAWAAKSLPRRQWLFAFDYYQKNGSDPKGSFSAGPGRVGSDSSFKCEGGGSGHLIPDHDGYDKGIVHDYSTDLADLVEDVLRATGADKVDIVAHSMGGLITRSYMTFMDGRSKIGNVLLLSTPHKGVPLATGEGMFSSDPDWMDEHELTELDRFKLLSRSDFSRCGQRGTDTWPNALMKAELATPPEGGPTLHCMKGSKDKFIFDGSANYERCSDYKVVDGVDHGGILKSTDASDEARAVLGGRLLP